MGALATGREAGQGALCRHLQLLAEQDPRGREDLWRGMGVHPLIHQPSHNMLNRWVEGGLLDALKEAGMGCIPFSPLAQGLLSEKYLNGIPECPHQPAGRRLAEADASLAGEYRPRQGAERDRQEARPEPGADGGRLGVARSAGDDGPGRRQLTRAGEASWSAPSPSSTSPRPSSPRSTQRRGRGSGINLWEKPSTDQRP